MRKKITPTDGHDQTLEIPTLPLNKSESVIGSETQTTPEKDTILLETEAMPVIEVAALSETETKAEATIEASSEQGDNDRQDLIVLALKMAELEDKFIKLQTELNTLINKKTKKNKKLSKDKKVKCKCKDKKVDLAKCKCKSKKLEKLEKLG